MNYYPIILPNDNVMAGKPYLEHDSTRASEVFLQKKKKKNKWKKIYV